jgi:aldehyde dehydrogenase (NAD+)
MTVMDSMPEVGRILEKLEIEKVNHGAFNGEWFGAGKKLQSFSPADGQVIAEIIQATREDYEKVIHEAHKAYLVWREIPAPQRGEIVRQIGNEFRKYKDELGTLVSLEMGKILTEGKGEIQEAIDIADFAVGLSRQLYGLTMKSERSRHLMMEQWHPLGVVGVITAFNFPAAVWAWNSMLAAVCGDAVLWKPSSKTPLTAIAMTKVAQKVLKENDIPSALLSLVIGRGSDIGDNLLSDKRLPLISFTGSVKMGKHVAEIVGKRLGRTILELGGNNAVIVTSNANLEMAQRAILFGAAGTAGQRCTSTRRIIAHKDIYGKLLSMLTESYKKVNIGHPLDRKTLMGPLIDTDAVNDMMRAVETAVQQGGRVVVGGEILKGDKYESGTYVTPCIIETKPDSSIVCEETFAPILYFMKYETLEEAISIHNNVPQGLSSAIFTNDVIEGQTFISEIGSDCGIANINIGTSGAEIGGAFGGEKETGGGRESGSDAWKGYMRRQTNTINWSRELPLAQGIEFNA